MAEGTVREREGVWIGGREGRRCVGRSEREGRRDGRHFACFLDEIRYYFEIEIP